MKCVDCGRELAAGEWPWPCGGSGDHAVHGGLRVSAIHTSERSVVYRNPRTGEVRFPARADQAVPAVYARQGFVREELITHAQVREFERETGRLHERSHYDPGSGRSERELAAHCEPRAGDPKPLPEEG